MCGIAGIFSFADEAPVVNPRELMRMREQMFTRGPDDAGEWFDQDRRVGLAHRRLSIIDLSERSRQPMKSPNSETVITFNGEIYNYKELTEELKQQGYNFRTTSDTEVLLHLYERDGVDMVYQLRGMFAFAIWDGGRQELFLARDPYGIKPLYYSDVSGVLRFASQTKALMAGGGISKDPDPTGWAGFHLFGSVPEPYTTWRDVKSLPAGTTLIVKRGGCKSLRNYFSIARAYAKPVTGTISADERAQVFRNALLDSTASHLVADVPVGCFLSAGIDSCALLALMSELTGVRVRAITLGFKEFEGTANDEVDLASTVADKYGAEHVVRLIGQEEFECDLPAIIDAMDQPSIDGINTWFVSKAASESGLKVAISGLGGDELFGGYRSFSTLPQWLPVLSAGARFPGLGKALRVAVSSLQKIVPVGNPKIGGLIEYGQTMPSSYLLFRGLFMPWELRDVLSRDLVDEDLEQLDWVSLLSGSLLPTPGSDFGQIAVLESSVYMRNQLLRDCDWASMAHSLEVRTPLVDSVLLQKLASLPRSTGKSDLARAPARALPDAVIKRPKTGFSTPVTSWTSRVSAEPRGSNEPITKPLNARGSRRWALEVARMWSATC